MNALRSFQIWSPSERLDMPVENGIPNTDTSKIYHEENAQPKEPAGLIRSPQPYQWCKNHFEDVILTPDHLEPPPSTASTGVETGYPMTSNPYQDRCLHKKLRAATSPSDSGTEADDESGVVLKGLPPPPIKWRKGLKDNEGQGTASPLLTPSYLDDDEQRLAIERQLRRSPMFRTPAAMNDEIIKIREKFTRRRRAELLRRTAETILLAIIGFVSCAEDLGSLRRSQGAGKLENGRIIVYELS